jgi:hypothetical protein
MLTNEELFYRVSELEDLGGVIKMVFAVTVQSQRIMPLWR